MTKLEGVQRSSLLRNLTDIETNALEGLFKEKRFKEGETIFLENMAGESLYLIKKGTVSISKMMGEGEEKILVVLGVEEFFGEMALMDGAPRMANARAAEESLLLSLGRSDFEALCARHPRLGLKLMRNMVRDFAQRLREKDKDYREMLTWALSRKS